MGDPFGRSVESDEVNSLLQNLIQSSFSHAPFSPHAPHTDTSAGFVFTDPGGQGFMADAARAYDFDDFDSDFKGAEVSEGPSDSAPRRSSKRARAAEVHNMSEKRRRSRINEKMKALQKLIPNSNKTDKASMLDEAIEYLKQLQLQVQMLSMRSGVSLYPYCTPLPEPGISVVGQDPLVTSNNDTPNHYPQSNQPNLFFPIAGVPDSKASFGSETSIGQHFQTLNHLASSKDIRQVSQLHLDMKCSGKNSSSGVSS